MSFKKIPISQYKDIPKGSRINAVYLDDKKFVVSSSAMALRKVCESLIRTGELTLKRIRGFGFSWISFRPSMMASPTPLINGVYLSESGDQTTMYLRLSLILKRLLIPQDRCIIEFDDSCKHDSVAGSETQEPRGFVLKEWNDWEEEPSESVQKRINALQPSDFKTLVPYKLGIVNKKYKTESWAHLVNTFVVYVFSFLKNGPSVLWDVQNSVHWKHSKMVMREGDRISPLSLPSEMQAAEACWMMGDLINILQFDRYSIYVNCCPVNVNIEPVEKEIGIKTPIQPITGGGIAGIHNPIPVDPDVDLPIMQPNLFDEIKPINVTLGRHLRPAFWVKDNQ